MPDIASNDPATALSTSFPKGVANSAPCHLKLLQEVVAGLSFFGNVVTNGSRHALKSSTKDGLFAKQLSHAPIAYAMRKHALARVTPPMHVSFGHPNACGCVLLARCGTRRSGATNGFGGHVQYLSLLIVPPHDPLPPTKCERGRRPRERKTMNAHRRDASVGSGRA